LTGEPARRPCQPAVARLPDPERDRTAGREAVRLRTATGRAGRISATDAIVAAFASTCPDPIILTTDPKDLGALADHAGRPITITRA